MEYREGHSGEKPFKRAYVALTLWFVGRAVAAAAAVDEEIAAEFAALPEGFTFSLGVLPKGPHLVVGKERNGRVRYIGGDPGSRRVHLKMSIRNLEAAMLMFTFQESTATATARNRLIVDGEVAAACAVVRVLDAVEVYLLPKFVASLAVKRYPDWPWERVVLGRAGVYLRALFGM
ncbi:MAG TPA: hypothetical protein PK836_05145 [Syntrophales bacterium]|nr:hypothetical protein [Syntrophales bacterium]HOM07038.1 hypothetical protein [Syntrophales bacterium]HON99563.1 hypothetical protein [Syntrophales bacterium]HPC01055.1 hypothetical protein [Syntrophales bacterium]HPQ06806.1 hypothetical protein [Syntrophales bacterium]